LTWNHGFSQHNHGPEKLHTCLTSGLTTSGARNDDLVVLFCTYFIPKRSHEKAVPYAKQDFYDS